MQLGYLTAERCGRIGQLIADGRAVRAVFQEKVRAGAVIRVAFDGEEPILPTAGEKEVPAEPGDFWPDFIPPDE